MQVHDEIQEADYITPNQPGGIPGWQEGIPVFRIYTCGLFTIEMLVEVPGSDPAQARYTELPTDRLFGRGPGSAQKAVKILLAQDERYATKDWLRTHLREGQEVCATNKRLENIISYLRCHLLCLPSGKKLSDLLTYRRGTEESGDGYQLASYPLVWVDVDALTWYVKHACLKERFGEDSLPYWERAYALASRGSFLVDEPNSEWASRRRKVVDDQIRQCVLALSRLYLARYGQAGEEDVLRLLLPYCRTHCQDEDALRSLLELLNKRGRYQEVLEWYKQLEDALAEAEPDKAGAMRTPHPLTAEIADFARLKLREGHQAKSSSVLAEGAFQSILYVDACAENRSVRSESHAVPVSHSSGEILDIASPFRVLLEESTHGAPDESSQQETSWAASLHLLPAEQVLQPSSWLGANVASFDPSRRQFNTQFFQFLGGLVGMGTISFLDPEVWERLMIAVDQPAALNRTSIDAFERFLAACWDFCDCGKMSIVEQLLLVFLSSVSQIAERQQDAARLAAEGLRLQSILSAHQLKMDEKLMQCLQSVKYARLAQEPNTLAASLHELTAAFRYTRQPDALFLVFQEALSFCEQVVPPIRAGIYAGAAAAFAQQKRLKEANFYIHLAYEVAAEDASSLLAATDNGLAHLAEYEGIVYLESGLPQKAYQVLEPFTHPKDTSLALPERNRLEMLNYQGQAALLGGEVKQYAHCLEKGIEGALTIRSKKRLTETLETFQQMPRQWLHEQPIKQVIERFQLPIGG